MHALATLAAHPESVPINALVPIEGHAARRQPTACDDRRHEFVRTIATARIVMPKSMVRLSAGRDSMSEVDAGALLPGRGQLDLRRRQAADCRKRRRRQGCPIVDQAWPQAARGRGADADPSTRELILAAQAWLTSNFREIFRRLAPVEHAVVANDPDPAQARARRQLGCQFEGFGRGSCAPRLKQDQIAGGEDRLEHVPVEKAVGIGIEPEKL